jgi:hypothetical protein
MNNDALINIAIGLLNIAVAMKFKMKFNIINLVIGVYCIILGISLL